jgi:hypothetical protein
MMQKMQRIQTETDRRGAGVEGEGEGEGERVGASGRGHGEARPGIPPQIQAILILIPILASSKQQKCSTYMVRTYGRSAGAEASRSMSMSMSMEHGAAWHGP